MPPHRPEDRRHAPRLGDRDLVGVVLRQIKERHTRPLLNRRRPLVPPHRPEDRRHAPRLGDRVPRGIVAIFTFTLRQTHQRPAPPALDFRVVRMPLHGADDGRVVLVVFPVMDTDVPSQPLDPLVHLDEGGGKLGDRGVFVLPQAVLAVQQPLAPRTRLSQALPDRRHALEGRGEEALLLFLAVEEGRGVCLDGGDARVRDLRAAVFLELDDALNQLKLRGVRVLERLRQPSFDLLDLLGEVVFVPAHSSQQNRVIAVLPLRRRRRVVLVFSGEIHAVVF